MREFQAITRALSDETRLRLLLALRGQRACLCQLVELVALAASTVSKHMSILRQSRLVDGQKEGRWMYYSLAGDDAPVAVRRALQWTLDSLADDRRATKDTERMREILLLDPQSLCARTCPPKKACSSSNRRERTKHRARGCAP
jgi:DNA-binding transcriptional ArsR family regulator